VPEDEFRGNAGRSDRLGQRDQEAAGLVGPAGAAREPGRGLFGPDDLAKQMSGKVWLADRAGALVDEIPSAYKDIDQVMHDQSDLVEVQHTLHQVLNYKGT